MRVVSCWHALRYAKRAPDRMSSSNMKIEKNRLLSMPEGLSKEEAILWLYRKCLLLNYFMILQLVIIFCIFYIVSPSLINFFTVVLISFLLLFLNALYLISIMFLALFFKRSRHDVANDYFIKNSFKVYLVIAVTILTLFTCSLIIAKFS